MTSSWLVNFQSFMVHPFIMLSGLKSIKTRWVQVLIMYISKTDVVRLVHSQYSKNVDLPTSYTLPWLSLSMCLSSQLSKHQDDMIQCVYATIFAWNAIWIKMGSSWCSDSHIFCHRSRMPALTLLWHHQWQLHFPSPPMRDVGIVCQNWRVYSWHGVAGKTRG